MIPYLGNKDKIFDFINPNLPKNPKKWVEPFGGGFNIFFSLDLNDYKETEFIYNDINPLNYNLFQSLKKDIFIKKVLSTYVDKTLFEESYSNLESTDKELKALSWLIILCGCDLKDIMSKNFKGNFLFESLKVKLTRYKDYFKRIKVYNLDYKKILSKYDAEDTFFYLDPPYFGYEKYYIKHNFKTETHKELSEELKNLKANWLLSYYKFEGVEDWYSNYEIISKKTNISNELLIIKTN